MAENQPFDYNQSISREADIAPMQSRFFPTVSPFDRDFDQSMKYYTEIYLPARQQTVKMQSDLMRMRQQQMQFKQLKQERRQQREFVKALPLVSEKFAELDRITDLSEKKSAFTDFQLEFANQITRSPVTQNMFSIKGKSINDEFNAQEKSRLKEQGIEQGLRNTLANILVQQGHLDMAQKALDHDTPLEELDEPLRQITTSKEFSKMAKQKFEQMEKSAANSASYIEKEKEDVSKILPDKEDDKYSSVQEEDLRRKYALHMGQEAPKDYKASQLRDELLNKLGGDLKLMKLGPPADSKNQIFFQSLNKNSGGQ